jgi:hypothetical protein
MNCSLELRAERNIVKSPKVWSWKGAVRCTTQTVVAVGNGRVDVATRDPLGFAAEKGARNAITTEA